MKAESFPETLIRSLVVFVVGVLLCSSCRSNVHEDANATARTDEVISATPPFKTKEPARYQAIRTITSTDPSGSVVTTRTLIARSEILRREETEIGTNSHMVLLESDQGRFVLLSPEKIYAEVDGATAGAGATTEFDNSPERLLHPEPLATSYQKLGPEQISGRNTTKYRVAVNISQGENVTNSETFIWIDESIGMPIRSEMKSSDGSRTLMEISNIVLEADTDLFRIPAAYAKVTAAELRSRLQQKRSR